MGIITKLKNAWNAFNETNINATNYNLGSISTYRPDRNYFNPSNERSVVNAIYNRMAIDISSIKIREVIVDDEERYISDVTNTGLSECLSLSANKDQTPRAFFQDVAQSLFDEGCIAIVPVDTDRNADVDQAFDVLSMRVGRITQWFPDYVELEVYNDRTGNRENITMPKSSVAIIENPLFSIMNKGNSVLKRLVNKLNILDIVDSQSGSNKLDLIIQLPYIVKTETRRQQAQDRLKDIREQLTNSDLGIAYTDGTEKITQLNRSVESNVKASAEMYTSMLYSQLGISESILNGTAKPEEINNYVKRTIEPITSAIVDELNRKFLSKTARTQGHRIMFFNDPFKLIPVDKIADIGDKLTRNEILSSNELRQLIGFKPVADPRANELINKNMPVQDQQVINDMPINQDPETATNQDLENLENKIKELTNLKEGNQNE